MRILSPPLAGAILVCAASASAVTVDWVFVGNVLNACDTQPDGCYGGVNYYFRISKHEVTNAQYTEFLNAVAAIDPNELYNTNMGDTPIGGITRSCPATCTYSAIAGRENKPVTYTSFYDALRFANWLHNGQPSGAQGNATTEDGAYTITAQGIADNSIVRNPGAQTFIPSEDEWFKAAYYNAAAIPPDYFASPTQSALPSCSAPTATANRANCEGVVGDLTDVGSYTGSASPYGTLDQAGNVQEWNEAIIVPDIFSSHRGIRGGVYAGSANLALKGNRGSAGPNVNQENFGIRVAPEAGGDVLLAAGVLTLACLQRRRIRRPFATTAPNEPAAI